jgi:nitroimidazol reductase NimA-like FMN-containing flavoprotein (pyridoxamine 5'-phosphate oxidase superfamily)
MKKSRNTIPDKVTKGEISVSARLAVLDKTQKHAVLATDSAGAPYASLISYACTPEMREVIFITPKATRKYRNILKNKQVSLLIDTRSNTEKDYLGAESVTITGIAKPVRNCRKKAELAAIFIRKHPRLEEFVLSPETALISVEIIKVIHVTRFQSVTIWDAKEERAPLRNRF